MARSESVRRYARRTFVVVTVLVAFPALAAAQDPSVAVFDENTVSTVRLTMSAANWDFIKNNPQSGTYVRASFTWQSGALSETFADVGVRASMGPWVTTPPPAYLIEKPSLRVKFDEFVPDRTWRGLSQVKVNYCSGGGIYTRRLGYWVCRQFGVAASRFSNCRLYVNGDYRGSYGLEEVVKKAFLRYHLGLAAPDGNLYKVDNESSDTGDRYRWRGSDPAQYVPRAFEPITNEVGGDYRDIVSLCNVVNNIPLAQRRVELDRIADVDGLLTYLALVSCMGDYDTLWNRGNRTNNHYWYHREDTNKLTIIPWDTEGCFWYAPSNTSIWANYTTVGISWIPNDPVARASVSDKARRVRDGPLAAASARADFIYNQIKSHVYADPYKLKWTTPLSPMTNAEFDQEHQRVKNYIRDRVAFLNGELGAGSPTNGAQFVSQSVPSTMTAGQTYSVTVALKNTGTTTWTEASYRLGSQNPTDAMTWGMNRVSMNAGESVAPNATKTFTWTVTAPATAGTYAFQWQMRQSGVEWFGALTPNVAVTVRTPPPPSTDDATFVSQNIPSTMTAGQTYPATVTMRNAGTTTWTAAGGYRLNSRGPYDNLTWGVNRIPVGTSVGPGQTCTFSFTVTAPAAPGTSLSRWSLANQALGAFGSMTPDVNVTVTAGAGNGLTGKYYDTLDLTGTVVTRVDPAVDFNWGAGSPAPGIAADTFSARWTGRVRATYTETYTFTTFTNDGVRLWVNGELLVDQWQDQSGGLEWSGSIGLEAGKRYTIQMDYYENLGNGVARLLWSSPSTPKEAIPTGQLVADTGLPPGGDIDGDGTPDLQDSDRDGDGSSNDIEMMSGTDPNDPASRPAGGGGGGGGSGGGCGATGLEALILLMLPALRRRRRATSQEDRMARSKSVLSLARVSLFTVLALAGRELGAQSAPAAGPLRVHPTNPRYFTDGSGKAVYLTGSHLGWELQDDAWGDKVTFNFTSYLDLLRTHNQNLIRLWCVENTRWSASRADALATPMPYRRTGPGNALDGGLKFDLNQFNPSYFDRMRARVIAARDRGMYVMVMLFQGFSVRSSNSMSNPWIGHPFNKANNLNGVNGDLNNDGWGLEVHTLASSALRARQEAYVRKVIDTVNDLDNVLYEISNESPGESKNWQTHFINFIKNYESGKPEKHPVVFSIPWPGVTNADLFASPADAIAPNRDSDYFSNPPAATGTRVVIADSDHIASTSHDPQFVWKNFMRGNNPIVLDWDLAPTLVNPSSTWDPIRRAMGHTRRYANRMNLAAMTPQNSVSSTGYCLARTGSEYLVYQPGSGGFTVSLASGTYSIEWLNPGTGATTTSGGVSGGATRTFTPPFGGNAVLYLKATLQSGLTNLQTQGTARALTPGGSADFPGYRPPGGIDGISFGNQNAADVTWWGDGDQAWLYVIDFGSGRQAQGVREIQVLWVDEGRPLTTYQSPRPYTVEYANSWNGTHGGWVGTVAATLASPTSNHQQQASFAPFSARYVAFKFPKPNMAYPQHAGHWVWEFFVRGDRVATVGGLSNLQTQGTARAVTPTGPFDFSGYLPSGGRDGVASGNQNAPNVTWWGDGDQAWLYVIDFGSGRQAQGVREVRVLWVDEGRGLTYFQSPHSYTVEHAQSWNGTYSGWSGSVATLITAPTSNHQQTATFAAFNARYVAFKFPQPNLSTSQHAGQWVWEFFVRGTGVAAVMGSEEEQPVAPLEAAGGGSSEGGCGATGLEGFAILGLAALRRTRR